MRYYAPIKISDNMRETPEGFLVCIGVPIARTGEMVYDKTEIPLDADSNGKIKVSRSDKEVFRPETIASFEGKPITITHPKEDVTPENWKDLAKGEIVNVRRGDGEFSDSLMADLLVKDKTAIALVKSGLREVSCGYDADWLQEESGVGWQENIYGNHLALVDQGRAGSSYAINDSKGKGTRMKLSDKIKAIFAKAQDEALKVADAEAGQQSPQDPATGKPAMAMDAMEGMMKTMDEMKKCMDSMSEKIGAMGQKPASDETPAMASEEAGVDEEVAPSVEDRLKVLEAGLSKLLEMSASAQSAGDEDLEEEGAEDGDFEESTMVGDSAKGNDAMSRAEILAPGIKNGKDLEKRALQTAYATKEGKKVIDIINGGRAPAFDTADKVKTLFTAASELLKVTRSKEMSRTKQGTGDAGDPISEPMTPEALNKKHEEFWKNKRAH